MLYSFEDFSLDTARRELRCSGALISLQPQVFDLLEYLIHNRELISKDDLFAAVWNRRIVSESTLSTRINAARNAIANSGEEQRLVRTAHGKGFGVVGSVREEKETVRKLAVVDHAGKRITLSMIKFGPWKCLLWRFGKPFGMINHIFYYPDADTANRKWSELVAAVEQDGFGETNSVSSSGVAIRMSRGSTGGGLREHWTNA